METNWCLRSCRRTGLRAPALACAFCYWRFSHDPSPIGVFPPSGEKTYPSCQGTAWMMRRATGLMTMSRTDCSVCGFCGDRLDLVDHLFNSSEQRLARTLLLLAHVGKDREAEIVVPKISQESLAEIIGTTRARVSFFMNRFRKLGLIEYNGELRVHSDLLNIVLHD